MACCNCNSNRIIRSGELFWSDLGLNQGAVPGDFEIDLNPGSTSTLFFYFEHQGQNIAEGFDMDFSWNNPGVASFTAAETFNFDITLLGNPFDVRWEPFAGDAFMVDPNSVEGFLTVSLSDGINTNFTGPDFIDEGYDPANDSFLVGSITFEAVQAGTTQLQIDQSLIINQGLPVPSTFNSLTVKVVPEPAATFCMIFLGMVGFARRRNRSMAKI